MYQTENYAMNCVKAWFSMQTGFSCMIERYFSLPVNGLLDAEAPAV